MITEVEVCGHIEIESAEGHPSGDPAIINCLESVNYKTPWIN